MSLFVAEDGQNEPKTHLELMAEMRDYKRRRQSYRAKNVHITKKSYTEVRAGATPLCSVPIHPSGSFKYHSYNPTGVTFIESTFRDNILRQKRKDTKV